MTDGGLVFGSNGQCLFFNVLVVSGIVTGCDGTVPFATVGLRFGHGDRQRIVAEWAFAKRAIVARPTGVTDTGLIHVTVPQLVIVKSVQFRAGWRGGGEIIVQHQIVGADFGNALGRVRFDLDVVVFGNRGRDARAGRNSGQISVATHDVGTRRGFARGGNKGGVPLTKLVDRLAGTVAGAGVGAGLAFAGSTGVTVEAFADARRTIAHTTIGTFHVEMTFVVGVRSTGPVKITGPFFPITRFALDGLQDFGDDVSFGWVAGHGGTGADGAERGDGFFRCAGSSFGVPSHCRDNVALV